MVVPYSTTAGFSDKSHIYIIIIKDGRIEMDFISNMNTMMRKENMKKKKKIA